MNNDSEQKSIRKKYSPQFKDQAVERADKDGVPQVAKDLGITESILYSWRSKKKQGGTTLEHQKLQQAKMARLKRECARLSEENAFLKKVAVYFTRKQSEVCHDKGRIDTIFNEINVSPALRVSQWLLCMGCSKAIELHGTKS